MKWVKTPPPQHIIRAFLGGYQWRPLVLIEERLKGKHLGAANLTTAT